tara:strand:- start:234 stop:794 length:561 start_codon:yes stop_codon:yes gene_type:complete
MNLVDISVSKIIYSHSDKKYKIIFSQVLKEKHFAIFLSSEHAKKIAMSLEGINSESLSSYDLIINLLSLSKIKLDKVILFSSNDKLVSNMNLKLDRNEFTINSSLADSIILSIKTFSKLQIDESLLTNNDSLFYNTRYNESFDNISSTNTSNDIDLLKKMLNDCIDGEKYETAAIIRDRLQILKNK